jgi:hypothetical protein
VSRKLEGPRRETCLFLELFYDTLHIAANEKFQDHYHYE